MNADNVDIGRIFKNIYGNSTAQSMDSLSGGFMYNHIQLKRPTGCNIKYMDEQEQSSTLPNSSQYRRSYIDEMTGGRRKSMSTRAASDVIYSSPFFAIKDNAKVLNWVTTTNLLGVFVNAQRSAIMVIPSDSTMSSHMAEIEKALKENKITSGTTAANEFIVQNQFPHKDYCLNVYGRDSADNQGMPYAVPETFSSNEVVRRTARSNAVFYLRFNNADNIEVAPSKDMTGGTKLKLFARCSNNVCVLQGDLPKAVEYSSGGRNVVNMTGGAKKTVSPRSYFARLIRHYNGDIDRAAYNFIGGLKCGGVSASTLLKHYSSNYTHAAFETMFSGDADEALDHIYSANQVDNAHAELQAQFHPRKNKISMTKAKNLISRYYEAAQEAPTAADANAQFLNNLEKLYGANDSVASFQADIATNAVRGRSGVSAFNDACELVDSLKECRENSKSIYNNSIIASKEYGHRMNTPLMRTIYGMLNSVPFVGIYSKETVPTPVYYNASASGSSFMKGGSTSSSESLDLDMDDEMKGGDKCPVCGKTPCACKSKDSGFGSCEAEEEELADFI